MYYKDKIGHKKRRKIVNNQAIINAVATGIFIGSLVLNIILVITIIVMGNIVGRANKTSKIETRGYRKIYIERSSAVRNAPEIALIKINGVISNNQSSDGLFEITGESLSKRVSDILKIIKRDSEVRGVILSINSPGGTVSASDLIYKEIMGFRKSSDKPVVAFLDELATSGGYYVASAADYIISMPTTITGSIGVIMYSFNIKALMDRFGVVYVPVKSAEHKDLASPFKAVNEKELSILKKIVDQMFNRFIDVIDRGRQNLSKEEIEKIADGRIFLGEEALKYGLVDKVGYFEDAVDYISQKIGISEPSIVTYRKTEAISSLIRLANIKLKSKSTLGPVSPLAVYYLWEKWFDIDKNLVPEF